MDEDARRENKVQSVVAVSSLYSTRSNGPQKLAKFVHAPPLQLIPSDITELTKVHVRMEQESRY